MVEECEPLFSIIIAAYNVEQYIEESVESVLKQKFDKKKIQIILVDDGSTDKTGDICDEITTKYPTLVEVIHQRNAGVAKARNAGLKRARGKYVNFLDADDLLGKNTLKKVSAFFNKHSHSTNVVAIPMRFFEAETGDHILNDKFEKGTRLVDLKDEPECKLLSASSSFIRKEVFNNGLIFDEKLTHAEDAKLIQTILLDKPTLGLVSDCIYYYRRRNTGSSAVQNSYKNKDWYGKINNNIYKYLINLAKKKCGYVPKFIQHVIAYDLQWRIKQNELPKDLLTKNEIIEYKKDIFEIFNNIDDDVIIEQKWMLIEPKFMLLTKKHKSLPMQKLVAGKVVFSYGETDFYDLADVMINIDEIKIEDNKLVIEGWTIHNMFMEENFSPVVIRVGEIVYDAETIERREETGDYSMDIRVFKRIGFMFKIPLSSEKKNIEIEILRRSVFGLLNAKTVIFQRFTPLTERLHSMYFNENGWTMKYRPGKIFLKKERKKIFKYEKWLILELLYRGERHAVVLRIVYYILSKFKRKPILLISDDRDRARDNGESFFNYINTKHKDSINSYFVINKDCADVKRLQKVGAIISPASFKHKILFLLADYNLMSIMPKDMFLPFGDHTYCYANLVSNTKNIFLQHGVTKGNISKEFNKYNYNLTGFVTSSKKEADSIKKLKKEYFYNDDTVWLTGMPRFDILSNAKNKDEKLILIMPTWRRWILNKYNSALDIWEMSGDFKKTDFFLFYNKLINHPKLLEYLDKKQYKISFILHPSMSHFINDFDNNNYVNIYDGNIDYSSVFSEGALLVTDYSSNAFDFAYLKKPVIYTHFDSKRYFSGEHIEKKGYFDYQKDGFGEIKYTVDETVETIMRYIKSGCKMKKKYEEKVDSFFTYKDRKSCERIYKKLNL